MRLHHADERVARLLLRRLVALFRRLDQIDRDGDVLLQE